MEHLFSGVLKNRKVLITGHTGFKGSWLCLVLHKLGADIYGYALDPPTNPSLYQEARIEELVTSYIADIRDYHRLFDFITKIQPEIVIHLAAQPLVRESYKNPVETYAVNIMGTVNLLDIVRYSPSVKAVINVTTDKCYENKEWYWGYRENEPLGGYDPYSNSKGCSELVTASFRNSFFNAKEYHNHGVAVASARAGNVIGGGDWAEDRLIPDFIRAISKQQKIKVRNPHAIRPWQHVLEPLYGYLTLSAKLLEKGNEFAQSWNFGPDDRDAKSVDWIINTLCKFWGEGASYELDNNPHPHEANYLKLDCSKAKAKLNWEPKWNIEKTIKNIVDWNKAWLNGENMRDFTNNQIMDYFKK